MPKNSKLTTIGWRERVDLPDWGLHGVRAKVDTGARTSAIDVANIEHISDDRVRFEVVSRLKPRKTDWIEASLVRTSKVRPSSGSTQERAVCITRIRIGSFEYDVELSLVCRKGMLCRMLIGRTALKKRFVVDPSRTNVLSKTRSKNKDSGVT